MSLVLARIGKPHGLRGEVTVQVHTDDPEARFADGTVVDTEAAPGSGVPRRLTIRSTRVHNGIWLLAFEEVPDRTGAEGLRGARLVLDEDGPVARDDSDDESGWYEDELVGREVRDESGARLGVIAGLDVGPAQDRLQITLDDGTDVLLPFVAPFVPTVAHDHIVVTPPPGLFDLYRDPSS